VPKDPSAPATQPAHPSNGSSRASDVGRSLKTAAYVAIAVVATIFLLRNSQSVEVDFVFTSVEVPLFLVLLATLIVGAVLALGAQGLRHRKKSRQRRSKPSPPSQPQPQPQQDPPPIPGPGEQ
jgi:uncharacterized integral membrane protein